MKSSNENPVAEKVLALINDLQEKNADHFKEQLTSYINELIKNDFSALVQLLYRVDVDEKKLKELLQKDQDSDAAIIISDLIIERQIKKNEIRKKFKTSSNIIDGEPYDEEPW